MKQLWKSYMLSQDGLVMISLIWSLTRLLQNIIFVPNLQLCYDNFKIIIQGPYIGVIYVYVVADLLHLFYGT